MKINGWDIAVENARQHTASYGHNSITNKSEWIAGSLSPVFAGNEVGFQDLEIVLVVKGCGRDEILRHVSRILAHLKGPVELELDGRASHKFYGILKKCTRKETSMNRWHNLTLTFNGYEFSGLIVRQSAGRPEFDADNPGTLTTPVLVEVTPRAGCTSAVLSGLCRDAVSGAGLPIRMKNLVAGKTVAIDGETGLVTQDGEQKAGDVEFWDVPALLPGENRIAVDGNGGTADVVLKYHPRYM